MQAHLPHALHGQQRDQDKCQRPAARGTGPRVPGGAQLRACLADAQLPGQRAPGVLPEGLLHQTVGDVGQHDRGHHDRCAVREGYGLPFQQHQAENEQGPVPQVERVGDVAEPAHGAVGQPTRDGPPAAAEDHQDRPADRVEGGGAGEEGGAVEQQAGAEHHRQPREGEPLPQPRMNTQTVPMERQQPAQRELPHPGPRGVVVQRLVHQVHPPGVAERCQRDGEQERGHPAGEIKPGAPGPDDARRQSDRQEVELPLHRHRPQVLQRTDRAGGGVVVGRLGGQLPVLEIEEAGGELVDDLHPPHLRHPPQRHRGRGAQDHQQRRVEAADRAPHRPPGVRGSVLPGCVAQL